METNETQQNNQQQMSWSDKLIELRMEWTQTVKELAARLENINTIERLMNDIYIKRQDAVDVYFSIMRLWHRQINQYKVKSAEMYNNYKMGTNGIRYSSDSSIQLQIDAALVEEKNVIDDLKIFAEFMWESVKSIDNIIYAMKDKLKISEIQHGIKF